MKQDKVGMVMKEFKRGDLKSSSGQKVTNPKQAMAIALSEAGKSKKGSSMKKMADGGRIASKGEHSVQTKSKRGAEMVKMAKGGLTKSEVKKADAAGRKVTRELKYDDMKDRMMKMAKGGGVKKMRTGGKTC